MNEFNSRAQFCSVVSVHSTNLSHWQGKKDSSSEHGQRTCGYEASMKANKQNIDG